MGFEQTPKELTTVTTVRIPIKLIEKAREKNINLSAFLTQNLETFLAPEGATAEAQPPTPEATAPEKPKVKTLKEELDEIYREFRENKCNPYVNNPEGRLKERIFELRQKYPDMKWENYFYSMKLEVWA
jgi:hypothetical protein